MFGAANPLTHIGGAQNPADAQEEIDATYADHIPYVMAGTVVVAGVVLYLLNWRWDFRFVTSGTVGRG